MESSVRKVYILFFHVLVEKLLEIGYANSEIYSLTIWFIGNAYKFLTSLKLFFTRMTLIYDSKIGIKVELVQKIKIIVLSRKDCETENNCNLLSSNKK